jgi:hypothetical protein
MKFPETTRADPEVESRIVAPFKKRNAFLKRLGGLLVGRLGWALTILGLAGVALLPLPQLQKATYIDENALLPGQVGNLIRAIGARGI